MTCKFCNAQMEDDCTVCPACGAEQNAEDLSEEMTAVQQPVEEEAVAETEVTVEEETETTVQEEPEQVPGKKLPVKLIAIVCSVVLLLGLGVALWYGITGGFASFGKDEITVKNDYTEEDTAAAQKAGDRIVAKIGDKTLTNSELQVLYWMQVASFMQQNSYYLSYYGLDPTQPLSDQYISADGLTWEQYFLENALNNWHYYQCLIIEAERKGIPLSDGLAQNIDSIISSMETTAAAYGHGSVDAMLQADIGATVTAEAYRKYVELYYGGMEYFASIYDGINPTREEVENYFNINGAEIEQTYGVNKESGKLVDVRHILISVEGGTKDEESGQTVYSDEEWAACLENAEKILKTWQEGAATEDSFALLANTFSTDPGSNTTGGLYTYIYDGQMVKNFNAWCFDASRQPGDVGIVQSDFGYHIIYFVKGDDGWFRRSEQALIEATCTQMLTELMDANPMLVSYKSIVLSPFSLF